MSLAVPVTVDNFRRAQTDRYFAITVRDAGGIGRLRHQREVMPIDRQAVVRSNRDTLYSSGVFDLDAGPVTITLPDPGKRFLSLMVIDEDHCAPIVAYGDGTYTITRDRIGTRYALVAMRTLADPGDPVDLDQAHHLQDAMVVEQKARGSFEVPSWDEASLNKVRGALVVLGETLPDSKRMFGARESVDPVRHLIGTAIGWGGNPEKDATYLIVTPKRNDGETVYGLTVRDVPVDGFWSVSVYNGAGYFEPNEQNAYSLNSITAQRSGDGSVTIQFGGCDRRTPNCLPIVAGWNYTVRLYRPRAEILEGRWRFPEARVVERHATPSVGDVRARGDQRPRP
ncbi:MAG TPA: DUF1254 domain-containing protein [Gemmatimonadaceae bacterium]|nr:DUF1254 domain-containing protein [Gemmatimonadaceae bacterium]